MRRIVLRRETIAEQRARQSHLSRFDISVSVAFSAALT